MTMTDDDRGQDLVIERHLPGPPARVWSMLTEPEHFAAWYGPTGAAVTVATMDVRVGGRRLLRMDVQTPNGAMQMWFTGEYLDVVENQLLVYTDAICDEHGNALPADQTGMPAGHPTTTQVHIELTPRDGDTTMVLRHVGIPAGSPGAIGWTMALDKLEAHLSDQPID